MVSAKRLAQMAKKWQKMAAMGRKRLTWTARGATDECCAATPVAVKGHFVVYTAEGARFEVPLPYLVFRAFWPQFKYNLTVLALSNKTQQLLQKNSGLLLVIVLGCFFAFKM